MDIIDRNTNDDPNKSIDMEETAEGGISFEDFLFWGGFLRINIDEERMERRRKKKKERNSTG